LRTPTIKKIIKTTHNIGAFKIPIESFKAIKSQFGFSDSILIPIYPLIPPLGGGKISGDMRSTPTPNGN
jgi:hypothetical protein